MIHSVNKYTNLGYQKGEAEDILNSIFCVEEIKEKFPQLISLKIEITVSTSIKNKSKIIESSAEAVKLIRKILLDKDVRRCISGHVHFVSDA